MSGINLTDICLLCLLIVSGNHFMPDLFDLTHIEKKVMNEQTFLSGIWYSQGAFHSMWSARYMRSMAGRTLLSHLAEAQNNRTNEIDLTEVHMLYKIPYSIIYNYNFNNSLIYIAQIQS